VNAARFSLVSFAVLVALVACNRGDQSGTESGGKTRAAAVDAARIIAADNEPGNWMSHGRTYSEQRFSPLKQLDTNTVRDLKLTWHFDLPTDRRGQESTPLVVDGVMYVTSAWSKVFALDAKNGALLWQYDPQVPREWGINACCDVVNRGVAVWNGRVYVGTLDGRLVALDAATGKPAWEKLTIDPAWRYTITGAPRVVKGKVLIGNGGGEMGVRGYISAYDAATGDLAWRFYTVPGDPSKPFENPILEQAAKTWTGEWWKLGGGGTVWDSMAYDDKLDLLYIGVGNGSPWNRKLRSPGGGDNLFLSSIVALRPDTGEYVWHYQTTPGETWDFTATQHMILATLKIDGRDRDVIMQAPKNGFFYVIDRTDGQLISAQPFVAVNWATGVDLKTGRPIEVADARYGETGKPWLAIPGPGGAHNWQPMSFSPLTGLVYLPVTDMAFPYIPDAKFERKTLAWNVGIDLNAGSLPQDEAVKKSLKEGLVGHLAAWDPVAQKEVWRAQYDGPWNGALLSTAGNLVFQGTAMGELVAYQADNGTRLWSAPTQAGVVAAPITYEIDGEQYVAVEVGWGGVFGLAPGELTRDKHLKDNLPRVLSFKLQGTDALPEVPPTPVLALQLPPDTASDAVIAHGKERFHVYCGPCHGDAGVSSGILTDLRYSTAVSDSKLWQTIVHDGAFKGRGMIGFGAELSADDIDAIRSYVIRRAHESKPKAQGSP
jgi:alcohol dehydrogenase (cytochrome c)/quinohemoprotein ethanol dehydrogenase